MREELIAIEELYKEYGFGWIEFKNNLGCKKRRNLEEEKKYTKVASVFRLLY